MAEAGGVTRRVSSAASMSGVPPGERRALVNSTGRPAAPRRRRSRSQEFGRHQEHQGGRAVHHSRLDQSAARGEGVIAVIAGAGLSPTTWLPSAGEISQAPGQALFHDVDEGVAGHRGKNLRGHDPLATPRRHPLGHRRLAQDRLRRGPGRACTPCSAPSSAPRSRPRSPRACASRLASGSSGWQTPSTACSSWSSSSSCPRGCTRAVSSEARARRRAAPREDSGRVRASAH